MVGNYSRDSGLIVFNNGIDYGDSLVFHLKTYDPALEPESGVFGILVSLTGLICLATPVLCIVLITVGFSSKMKGMGIGAILGLFVYPLLAIIAFKIVWQNS
jgi:hypothetical protein